MLPEKRPIGDNMADETYELIRKQFNDNYSCEEITSSEHNLKIIQGFSGGEKGKGLENYLKNYAWEASKAGRSRVYLIKKKETGELLAYYSIKCGMLYSPLYSEQIQGEDRDFFELILDAMRDNDENLLADYKASGMCTLEEFKKLYDEAKRIIDADKDSGEGIHTSYDVAATYPAIEIENLCRNFAVESHGKIPFGFLVFIACIIPQITDIAQNVGCEYIYIYAADQKADESEKQDKKGGQSLVSYYKTNFGFHDAEALHFIRPRYDYRCYEMVQSVQEAIEFSKSIWNQIEDIEGATDLKNWL